MSWAYCTSFYVLLSVTWHLLHSVHPGTEILLCRFLSGFFSFSSCWKFFSFLGGVFDVPMEAFQEFIICDLQNKRMKLNGISSGCSFHKICVTLCLFSQKQRLLLSFLFSPSLSLRSPCSHWKVLEFQCGIFGGIGTTQLCTMWNATDSSVSRGEPEWSLGS